MRQRTALVLGMSAALAVASCKTITEDLPTQPTATPGSAAGNPVLVVVPVPAPSSAPNNPQPTPPPSNAPAPTPSASPVNTAPPPSNGGGGGGEGDIPNNTSPVAMVIANVFFIERDGKTLPDTKFATRALVGDRVHFDCVAKDAGRHDTRAKGTPDWSFGPPNLVKVKDSGSGGYTPAVIMLGRGTVSASVRIDGVTSNTVKITVD